MLHLLDPVTAPGNGAGLRLRFTGLRIVTDYRNESTTFHSLEEPIVQDGDGGRRGRTPPQCGFEPDRSAPGLRTAAQSGLGPGPEKFHRCLYAQRMDVSDDLGTDRTEGDPDETSLSSGSPLVLKMDLPEVTIVATTNHSRAH